MRRPDWEQLLTISGIDGLRLVSLGADGVPGLVSLGFNRLQSLSLRHVRTSDLSILEYFPQVENLEVEQSEEVTSINGIEALRRVRRLSLSELGPLRSLEPLSALHGIQELLLTGGVWKDQKLSGDFAPLAALSNLQRLTITNVRGPKDLTPLLGFDQLECLRFATALFPIQEVARLAARYPFWREHRPWLQPLKLLEECPQCHGGLTALLLQHKKRIWCERCEADRLGRILGEFDSLIQKYQC